MINLPNKFDAPIFTHYENIKGKRKLSKLGCLGVVRGHSRSLEIAPFAIIW